MDNNSRIIHAAVFSIAVFSIVVISQLEGGLLPANIYFSFKSFLLLDEGKYRFVSLAIKLVNPLICGGAITYLYARNASRSFEERLSFYVTARKSLALSLFMAGFFAALLQAWPFIAYWDVFADPRILDFKFLFLLAYGFYMLAFGYFCLAGGLASLAFLQHRFSDDYYIGQDTIVKFTSIARNGVLGFMATGLGTSLLESIRALKISAP